MVAVMLGTVATLGAVVSPASASASTLTPVGLGTASQAAPPAWCLAIPPEWSSFFPDCGPAAPPPGASSTEVESHYMARGPWAVTTSSATAPGTPGVLLVRPSNLGANGYRHPIVSWGNGTSATCEATEANGNLFSHLASWGYVVVCAKSGWTGSGAEILAAARWTVDQNANPSSVFYGKLDTARVGASGASQGASGAVNAMIQSGGLIRSAGVESLTDPWIHIWGAPPDFTRVDRPLFLISGTTDWMTSQSQQQTYFNQVRGPVAKAALVGVGHDPVARDRGYLTAWFEYTLRGDQYARRALAGSPPEIGTNAAWTNWAGKSLP